MSEIVVSKGALDFIVGTVAQFAGTEQSRPILMSVLFDPENRTVVATDSYVLARWIPETPDAVRFPERQVMVPADALVAAGKMAAKAGAEAPIVIRFEAGEIATPFGTVRFDETEGTYPPYVNLIADTAEPEYRGAWGPAIFRKFAKLKVGKGWNFGNDFVIHVDRVHSSKPNYMRATVHVDHGRSETVHLLCCPVRVA